MITRRHFVHTRVTAGLLASTPARAANNLVLVELFTSQGCSSCPPADVVALAFHVDYWDQLGWKDPFSSPEFTRRQRRYRAAFGNRSIYTPQMVFNGSIEFPGQEEREAACAVTTAASRSEQRPVIALQHNTDNSVLVNIDQGSAASNVSVFAAVYGRVTSTNVPSGENAGRKLANVNIAKSLERLGTHGGIPTQLTWRPDLANAAGVAVWLQPENLGPVQAVAQLRVSDAA